MVKVVVVKLVLACLSLVFSKDEQERQGESNLL